jgi:hypothetical protein
MTRYSINELYVFTPEVGSSTFQRPNPLTEKGALNAAEFVDMQIAAQRSRVGIIFDIRGLSFDGSNTALLVLTGVGNVSWDNETSEQSNWTARPGNWEPSTSQRPKPGPRIKDPGWARDAPLTPVTAVDNTTPQLKSAESMLTEFTLSRAGLWDGLTVSGLQVEMYIGHVEGMDDSPPDMGGEPDAAIIAGFPQWSSVMTVREHYRYPEPEFSR